jgi:4,4'-diaponeurosporenoate glycosyltransferase
LSWFELPDLASLVIFLFGWLAGWLVFWRAPSLPSAPTARTLSVSVIVPCRNEAENLVQLLPTLQSSLKPSDEIIVVDDESSDETVEVAKRYGVVVLRSGELPDGWTGKSHACFIGSQRATCDVLLFVDADVRVGKRAVDDLVALLNQRPEAIVSAMPWHRTVGAVERLSMLFNTVSAMVASSGDERSSRRVAYGPFLAVHRDHYMRLGGHSHESVRASVVDDLALARLMPFAIATIAREHQVEYRMYPRGAKQLWEGWTKNTATGALAVPRWVMLLVVAWVVSLCGGPFTSVWCYAVSAVQVAIITRRTGNFGPFSAALYPLHAAFFVVVAARSLVRSALIGRVSWRGRTIATR